MRFTRSGRFGSARGSFCSSTRMEAATGYQRLCCRRSARRRHGSNRSPDERSAPWSRCRCGRATSLPRRADSTPIGTLTCWIRAIMRGQHSTPVNSQILGGPPGYEAGAVAIASDVDRQGPNEPAGQASQQFDREPGEPGTAGHGEEAGAADAQDGRDARVRRVAELRQDRGERGAALVARSGRGPVEVDPGIAREVYTPHASTNAHSRCVRGL